MKTFVVKRFYGKSNSDYLMGWCDRWGTSCIGSFGLALKFDTVEDTQDAAKRAQNTCMGVDGLAQGFIFKAVAVELVETLID